MRSLAVVSMRNFYFLRRAFHSREDFVPFGKVPGKLRVSRWPAFCCPRAAREENKQEAPIRLRIFHFRVLSHVSERELCFKSAQGSFKINSQWLCLSRLLTSRLPPHRWARSAGQGLRSPSQITSSFPPKEQTAQGPADKDPGERIAQNVRSRRECELRGDEGGWRPLPRKADQQLLLQHV